MPGPHAGLLSTCDTVSAATFPAPAKAAELASCWQAIGADHGRPLVGPWMTKDSAPNGGRFDREAMGGLIPCPRPMPISWCLPPLSWLPRIDPRPTLFLLPKAEATEAQLNDDVSAVERLGLLE